jgi:hypothetical protein
LPRDLNLLRRRQEKLLRPIVPALPILAHRVGYSLTNFVDGGAEHTPDKIGKQLCARCAEVLQSSDYHGAGDDVHRGGF